jgi:hypothetical protein
MGKKHFRGTGKTLIHTTRNPPACRKKKDCKYTAKGMKLAGVTSKAQAAHHIIPVSVLIAYQADPAYNTAVRTKISGVYRGTDYCANHEGNVIWLPKKKAYINLARRIETTSPPASWGYKLPCHDWDHPEYTSEAKERLRAKVWDKFVSPTTPEDCPDPEKVSTQLTKVENKLRKELERRGKRVTGGVTAIMKHVVGRTADPEWCMNYSMADDDCVHERPAFGFATAIVRGLKRKRR